MSRLAYTAPMPPPLLPPPCLKVAATAAFSPPVAEGPAGKSTAWTSASCSLVIFSSWRNAPMKRPTVCTARKAEAISTRLSISLDSRRCASRSATNRLLRSLYSSPPDPDPDPEPSSPGSPEDEDEFCSQQQS